MCGAFIGIWEKNFRPARKIFLDHLPDDGEVDRQAIPWRGMSNVDTASKLRSKLELPTARPVGSCS